MKHVYQEPLYFLSAKRTAFGSFLGSLREQTATDLGSYAAQASLVSASILPKMVDHVIFGNVLQTSKDAIYLARHIGLRCEIPQNVPSLTINRLCGSGFEAIIMGARLIETKEANCVLVGGSENMSQAPHVIRGARTGLGLAQGKLEDSLWECLDDSAIRMSMGMTAENLAEAYAISQEEVDEYCVLSQTRYQNALKDSLFDDEISPVVLNDKRGQTEFKLDEHPRKDTSLDTLKRLPKVFKKEGVIHAAAASGICDGASALILCNESFLDKTTLKPLGQLISFGITGCDPKIMGIGPVTAIKECLEKVALTLSDMAMIEINEAFAPQVLAVKKELNLESSKLNIHGGALAIGHPLAASGARITTHLLHSLKHSKNTLGLGAACIGGGQGISVLIKSC